MLWWTGSDEEGVCYGGLVVMRRECVMVDW